MKDTLSALTFVTRWYDPSLMSSIASPDDELGVTNHHLELAATVDGSRDCFRGHIFIPDIGRGDESLTPYSVSSLLTIPSRRYLYRGGNATFSLATATLWRIMRPVPGLAPVSSTFHLRVVFFLYVNYE